MFHFLFVLLLTITTWAQSPLPVTVTEPLVKDREFSLVMPPGCASNPMCIEVKNNTAYFIAPGIQGKSTPGQSLVDSGDGTPQVIFDGTRFVPVIAPGESAWVLVTETSNRFVGKAYVGPTGNVGPYVTPNIFPGGVPAAVYGDQFKVTVYSFLCDYTGGLHTIGVGAPIIAKTVTFRRVQPR